MHSKIEYIAQLLNRKIKPKESEIEQLFSSKEDSKIFSEIYEIREAIHREKQTLKIDIDKEYNQFANKISTTPRIKALTIISIAASIIMLIGSYFIFINSDKVKETQIVEIIEPGKSKAILYLDDGRKIDLSQKNIRISDGHISGISNDSIKGLEYNNIKKEESSKIIYNTVKVPKGGEYQMTLSDGSKVWLNSESEIRFPVSFSGNKREVFIKGEAYFRIAHNENMPFVTRFKNGNITVLGTEYNIKSYEDEKEVVTTLVKGSVKFTSSINNNEKILKPNQQLTYRKDKNTIAVHEVDTYVFTAWKEGKFYFRSMPLNKIMKQLERWYNINVFFSSKELKDYKFRGVILKDMSFNEALKIIEETTDIRFKIKENTVTIYKK